MASLVPIGSTHLTYGQHERNIATIVWVVFTRMFFLSQFKCHWNLSIGVPLTTGLHFYVNTCSPPSSSSSSSSFSTQSSSHHHHRHHLHCNHSHHYAQQHCFLHHNHNAPSHCSHPSVFMGVCNRKIKLHWNIYSTNNQGYRDRLVWLTPTIILD